MDIFAVFRVFTVKIDICEINETACDFVVIKGAITNYFPCEIY